jgi:hypothetical protein
MKAATDRNGIPVRVGSRVRVLSIPASVMARLTVIERRRVKSMQGEVFTVAELDEYGSAWVTKWWHHRDGKSSSHSLALSAEEMEVVANAGNDA